MVSAYAAFANGGIGVQPHVIARVRTANGKQLYARRNANFGRVIDPQYVAMMNEMMQETLLTGTARKAELPGWQAAGKTGTSQDWRDAWFLGYTSYLVAGVWLGNDDSSPTKKVSGGNLPVEIWSRFMKAAHEGVPVAGLPDWDLAQRRGAEPGRFAIASAQPHRLRRLGTGGRGGRAAAAGAAPREAFVPQARAAGPRGTPGAGEDGALLPPADIPNAGRGPAERATRGCSTSCSERREERPARSRDCPAAAQGANLKLRLIGFEERADPCRSCSSPARC